MSAADEGAGRPPLYHNVPPHVKSASQADGGNEVFADGSASWIKFAQMWRLYRFSGVAATDIYWYQEQSDFEPTLTAALPSLR